METSTLRKSMPVSALFDPKIVVPAIGSAFVKLNPRTLMANPVMFVLEIVTALTTVILIRDHEYVCCRGCITLSSRMRRGNAHGHRRRTCWRAHGNLPEPGVLAAVGGGCRCIAFTLR